LRCCFCATELFERAKFCWECGARCAPPAQAEAGLPAALERERRSLTVMFCDLVGSTRLAHRFDPEELHDIISRYQSHCVESIVRHQGHVAQFLGDGVLVYFGYPVAHEDAALRAVRAGLEIIAGVDELNRLIRRHYDASLALRISIHRGLVVIGQLGSGSKREVLAIGETANIASKLQQLAEPNGILISAEVERLVRSEVETEDRGKRQIAGSDEWVPTYAALRLRGELAPTSRRLPQPLVARQQETAELARLVQRSAAGSGAAALLIGVPGIGKSRLIAWLEERVRETQQRCFVARCSAYTTYTPLAPIVTLQSECFQFVRSDTESDRLRKLALALDEVGLRSPLAESLLARLHALPPPAPAELAQLSPELQRRKTLELCANWLLAWSRRTGLVLIIDDLHWVDPTTDELLATLLAQLGGSPLSIVGAARPEFESPGWLASGVHRLELSRMVGEDVEQIVRRLTSGLPPELVARIVARSDGVPLFAEEMSIAALESSDPSSEQITPPTIQDLLQSRLDRLGAAKAVAQVCAAIGGDASERLIGRILGEDGDVLSAMLEKLARAQILMRRTSDEGVTYNFRHSVIRDTAYDGLIKAQRRSYHGRIAEALSEHADMVERQPEMVAYHFARSDQPGRSVSYWMKAGQLGVQRSTMLEAIEHLSNGLSCVESVPRGPERLSQELALHTLLSVSSMAAFGYANDAVQRHHARAAELCEAVRAPAETFPVSFGLWLFSLVRADRKGASEFARRLFEAAGAAGDAGFAMQAELATALTSYWGGEFQKALAHADNVIALYDERAHAQHALVYGDDPRVYGYVYRGMSQAFLGLPESALASLAIARRYALTQPPFTRVGARAFELQLLNLVGERTGLGEAALGMRAEAAEQGFPLFVGVGAVHAGWANVLGGNVQRGLTEIEAGIAGFASTGSALNLPYFEAHLAQACSAAGDDARASRVLDQALTRTETSLDTYYIPELLRLRAQIDLRRGESAAGLARLWRAVELARQQSSRLLELRALCTLVEAAADRQTTNLARRGLAALYAEYTEGHETADLRAARRHIEAEHVA
jgi:class 3 adenylate cyclase/predicted ATPase